MNESSLKYTDVNRHRLYRNYNSWRDFSRISERWYKGDSER